MFREKRVKTLQFVYPQYRVEKFLSENILPEGIVWIGWNLAKPRRTT